MNSDVDPSEERDIWISLEPEDVLLFRDSRPFSAGVDFRAEGGFPPPPPTVVGALRNLLFQNAPGFTSFDDRKTMGALREHLGDSETLGRLRFAGPIVCRVDSANPASNAGPSPVFPVPADLVGNRVPTLRAVPEDGSRNSLLSYKGALWETVIDAEPDDAAGDVPGDWIDEANLLEYLCGASTIKRLASPIVFPETRTGIALSLDRTAETGLLYNAGVHRPSSAPGASTGLLVRAWIPGGYAMPSSYVPLGGESRNAWVTPRANWSGPALHQSETRRRIAEAIRKNGGRYRLLLLTPGIFADGLVPRHFRKHALRGIASGKAQPISGWNVVTRQPRPMRYAVPPGSVYFGEAASDSNIEALVERFHLTCALQDEETDLPIEERVLRGGQGFGMTAIGCWRGGELE